MNDSHFEYLLATKYRTNTLEIEPHILSIVHGMIATELYQNYTYLHV